MDAKEAGERDLERPKSPSLTRLEESRKTAERSDVNKREVEEREGGTHHCQA